MNSDLQDPLQMLGVVSRQRSEAKARADQLLEGISAFEAAFRNIFARWVQEHDPITEAPYAILERLTPNQRYRWGIRARLFNDQYLGFSVEAAGEFTMYETTGTESRLETTVFRRWEINRNVATSGAVQPIMLWDATDTGRPLIDHVSPFLLRWAVSPSSYSTIGRTFGPDGIVVP